MIEKSRDPILQAVFDAAGGQAKLATALTGRGKPVTRMAVNQWKKVPDHMVRDVAEVTGLPLKKVRPDLFDPYFETKRKPGRSVAAARA